MPGRWLTPDSLPSSTIQCVLEFPDSEEIRSLIRGALYLLTVETNFEAFGAVTPQEISDALRQTLFLFNLEDCNVIPVGTVLAFAGDVIPDGFLDTNQGAVSRTTYARLFSVIGTQFGAGDGSTTFDLPHIDGRVIAGVKPGDSDFQFLGKTGGAKTHTLTVAEMPAHKHDTRIVAGGTTQRYATNATGNNTFTASQDMSNTGGDQAHNNMQPYIALNYIIKF